MVQHYLFGFLMVLSSVLLEVSPLPTNNEETTALTHDLTTEFLLIDEANEERSLSYERETELQDNVREILEKIKAINDGLKRPNRRPQINWNTSPQTGGPYIMDKDILEKLQQVIASGKLHTRPENVIQQDTNSLLNDDSDEIRYSRQMKPLLRSHGIPQLPVPYMVNLPVLVMPPTNNIYGFPQNNDLNSIDIGTSYQTRQGLPSETSSPFPFQWPFASFFPLLIRDPLLSLLNGGGWSNFVEYGQSADVCNRKQKSADDIVEEVSQNEFENESINEFSDSAKSYNSREGRALKKRTVPHDSQFQNIENTNQFKKIYPTKPIITQKPVKQLEKHDTKTAAEGDLRFPFGDFTWFGNRKPVAPSPGFFINKLRVRKGGVAIAGPGGVATAGRGGTAIVGPGGLAYTQPGGLAVAGPAARVVALSQGADLNNIVSRLQDQSNVDGSISQLLQAIPEGKVVATGPIIYYHPKEQL